MPQWYEIENADSIDSPALVIYTERVQKNIELLKQVLNDVDRLMPHIKTNKSPEAVKMMIDAGLYQFKCATIAEAELLGQAGARKVLLAYQPIGPKVNRFIELVKHYPKTSFNCLVDNFQSAKDISEKAEQNSVVLKVYIDINNGMNRSGIEPAAAETLFFDCETLKGIKIEGVHAYDGHIRELDLAKRTEICDAAFEPVEAFVKSLESKTKSKLIVVAGGTPTFLIHSKRPDVICSPGTFIYWDKGYNEQCKELPFIPAALVITRVISLPAEGKICVDLGHKSVAAENDISKRVDFLNAPELKLLGQSEEHLVIDAGANHNYKPGDLFYGIPYHICPTVALYDKATTITGGKATGEYHNIARNRAIEV